MFTFKISELLDKSFRISDTLLMHGILIFLVHTQTPKAILMLRPLPSLTPKHLKDSHHLITRF